jgi:hypothetical protein
MEALDDVPKAENLDRLKISLLFIWLVKKCFSCVGVWSTGGLCVRIDGGFAIIIVIRKGFALQNWFRITLYVPVGNQ